jgi:hypothetical protein
MVDAGHFDPKAVEGTKVLLEEKWVITSINLW